MTQLCASLQRKQVLSSTPIDSGPNRTSFIAPVNKTVKSIRESDSPSTGCEQWLPKNVNTFLQKDSYDLLLFLLRYWPHIDGSILQVKGRAIKVASCYTEKQQAERAPVVLRLLCVSKSSENSFQNSWVQIPADPKRKFADELAFLEK